MRLPLKCFFASFLVSFLALGPGLCAGAIAEPPQSLSLALHQLYSSRFDQSRDTLASYSTQNPQDPLAYSLAAASYLFAELDRSGAMRTDLLAGGKDGGNGRTVPMSEASRTALETAVAQARRHGQTVLANDPGNRNALLAMMIASGVERDYLAVVEHRYRESYDFMKESEDNASRLLKVDPKAYDAYFTRGFTEYLIGSMPAVLRWFMRMDNLVCTKEQGLRDLQMAAGRGQYMKPYAQLMLAMFYLREKKSGKTEQLLAELSSEYPENATFRKELAKLRSQSGAE